MQTKIQKWGNSLGVRLPKKITEEKLLNEGASVDVSIKNGSIVIEPVAVEVTLKSMLSSISIENLHQETDWSESQGKEIW